MCVYGLSFLSPTAQQNHYKTETDDVHVKLYVSVCVCAWVRVRDLSFGKVFLNF